jgi:glycerophosphoryl diester phosphodiesterase
MSRPLIIAHRGASAEAPENTRAAFRRAIALGAVGVEFDVRLAADGVPVVIHDARLERTAGLKRRVADLTSADLATMDIGSWFNRRHPHLANEPYSLETVPALTATLKLLGDLKGPIYVELKIDTGAEVAPLTDAVARVIAAWPLLPDLIVQSFDLRVITRIRKHLPEIKTAALFGSRLSHFVGGRHRIVDLALEHGATHLSLHRSLVNKRIAARAAAAGLPITAWTVDDPNWLLRANELGVYAVITNDPAKFLDRKR